MFGRGFQSYLTLAGAVLALIFALLVGSCVGSQTTGTQGLDDQNTDVSKPVADLQVYNATGSAPLTVGLDASASAAPAGFKSFDYDVDGDGDYDYQDADDNITHEYTTAGTYTAKVKVTDRKGNKAYATATVRVSAGGGNNNGGTDPEDVQDPDADLAIYPSTSVTGTAVVIDASNSKPNMAGTLTYDYDLDGDGDYDRHDAGAHFEYTYDEVGTYNVRVRVTNAGDRTDTATATVRIDASQGGGGGDDPVFDPPFVKLGFWPETVAAGDEVNFDASNSWARDGSALTYDYDFHGDGDYELKNAANTVKHIYDGAGTFTAVVRVTDGGGRQSTSSVQVTVTAPLPNKPPVAILTAEPVIGEAPLTVEFHGGSSYDQDGINLSFDWNFGEDTQEVIVDGGPTQQHTYNAPGTYTITLWVTDDDGATDSTTTTVTVQQPLGNVFGPEAKLSAAPVTGEVPLKVDFDAGASSDPNGTIIEYRFDFDGDGTFDLLSLDPAQSYTYTADGTYHASVTVEDNDGLTDSASVSITVGSGGGGGGGFAPVVVISNTPSFGSAPLSVSFSTEYSVDIDGEIVRFDWDLNNDGTFEVIDGGQSQSVLFAESGTHMINVRAYDNDGNTATGLGMIYLD